MVNRNGRTARLLPLTWHVVVVGVVLASWPIPWCVGADKAVVRRFGEPLLPAGETVGTWMVDGVLGVARFTREPKIEVLVEEGSLHAIAHDGSEDGLRTVGRIKVKSSDLLEDPDALGLLPCAADRGGRATHFLLFRRWSLKPFRAVLLTGPNSQPITVPMKLYGWEGRRDDPWWWRADAALRVRVSSGGAVIFPACADCPGVESHPVLHVKVVATEADSCLEVRLLRVPNHVIDARWRRGRVVVLETIAEGGTQLTAYDLSDGGRTVLWRHKDGASAGWISRDCKQVVVYADSRWERWRQGRNGWLLERVANLPGPSQGSQFAVSGSLAVWLHNAPYSVPTLGWRHDLSRVAAVDLEKGRLLWRTRLPRARHLLGMTSRYAVLSTNLGVRLLRLQDGRLEEHSRLPFSAPLLITGAAHVVVTAELGLVLVWSRSEGRVLREIQGVHWWAVDRDEKVVWCGDDQVTHRVDLRTGRVTRRGTTLRRGSYHRYGPLVARGGQVLEISRVVDPPSVMADWVSAQGGGANRRRITVTGIDSHHIIHVYSSSLVGESSLVLFSGHYDDAYAYLCALDSPKTRAWRIPSFGPVADLSGSGDFVALGITQPPWVAACAHFELWSATLRRPLMYGGFRKEPVDWCGVSLSPDGRHLLWSTRSERGGWQYDVYSIPEGTECGSWTDAGGGAGAAEFISDRWAARVLSNGALELRLAVRCNHSAPGTKPPFHRRDTRMAVRWVLYPAGAYDRLTSNVSLAKSVKATIDYLCESDSHLTLTFPVGSLVPLKDLVHALVRYGPPDEVHVVGPAAPSLYGPVVLIDRSNGPDETLGILAGVVDAFGCRQGGELYLWSPWIGRRLRPEADKSYSYLAAATRWAVYALASDLPGGDFHGYRPSWVRIPPEKPDR